MVQEKSRLIVESVRGVSALDKDEWNTLVGDGSPFLEHGFLATLEDTGCTGEESGWYPVILTCRQDKRLVGAVPFYVKTHSRGEFVFDWAWADAAQRAGIPYYPKATVAVPFSPVTGTRLLVHPLFENRREMQLILAKAAINAATEFGLSSVHFNFIAEDEVSVFEDLGIPIRVGVQYHWKNPEERYQSFDDYLARFRSKRRASVRRERRLLRERGVTTRIVQGNELDSKQMRKMFRYYKSTVEKFHWGHQYLNEDFFVELARVLPERLHLVFAEKNGATYAGAFNLLKNNHLYGRYWGCSRDVQFTHFEVCMYSAIEWCIQEGIEVFEPGAGGEHKHERGFEATKTYSAHYIREPALEEAIRNFLQGERDAIDRHVDVLDERGPFKG